MTGCVKLQPGNQKWVEISTAKGETIVVEPYNSLYDDLLCLTGKGIADVKSGQSFDIIVPDFGEQAIYFRPQQVVAYSSQHPKTIVESDITYAEVFGITVDDVDTKCSKRHVYAGDISIINKHLTDQWEQPMGEDEKPFESEDINVYIH